PRTTPPPARNSPSSAALSALLTISSACCSSLIASQSAGPRFRASILLRRGSAEAAPPIADHCPLPMPRPRCPAQRSSPETACALHGLPSFLISMQIGFPLATYPIDRKRVV